MISITAIDIRDLHKSYGSHDVLKGVDLQVEEGEVFGLLGPNGAGKTTLFQTLMGLLSHQTGEIKINGSQIGGKELKKEIGYLPSDISFYSGMTARENLEFFAGLAERDIDSEELLSQVELLDSADRKVGEFSTGMKKRLGIAQSLIKDPDIMIYDEPTTGLDPEGTRNFRRHVKRINREQNKTVIISSHITKEISSMCVRFGVLYRGEIVASGTKEELNEATEGSLEVRVLADDTSRLEEVLEDEGYSYTEDRDRISVQMDKDLRDKLFETLVEEGVGIREFELDEETLESAYLRLTGDK